MSDQDGKEPTTDPGENTEVLFGSLGFEKRSSRTFGEDPVDPALIAEIMDAASPNVQAADNNPDSGSGKD